jgi:hypothetical protein
MGEEVQNLYRSSISAPSTLSRQTKDKRMKGRRRRMKERQRREI